MSKFISSDHEDRLALKNGIATTPAMRRFLIGFAIVEAVLIGWALFSPHLR